MSGKSESTPKSKATQKATVEEKILIFTTTALGSQPIVKSGAVGLSHFGEHALGWLGLAGAGAVLARVQNKSQTPWVAAGVGAFGAHAASVIIKRIVRRPRPSHPDIAVGVSVPSKLSFPSSHATSTTAAAILLGRAAGLPRAALPAAIVPPMLISRLILGVHYPSDVLAGAVVGAVSAYAVRQGERLVPRIISCRGTARGVTNATVGEK